MPHTTTPLLKTHATEMASAYSEGLGIDPITGISIFLTLIQLAVRCWFSGGSEGAATAGHRYLKSHQTDGQFRPGVVKRARKHVRRTAHDKGYEPTEQWVADVADDLLRRGLAADEKTMMKACREGWK